MTTKEKTHKSVVSFVKREGRLTSGQQRALDNLWSVYGVDLQQHKFGSLFARPIEIVLEIGFGNGSALLELAQANPDTQYIGIDVHRPGIGALLLKLEENAISNVKVFQQDGVQVLQHFFPDASLTRINLFFPDPWPKKKHHKRRIVQSDFMQLVARKLVTEGVFHFATDWQDYAEHTLEILSQQTALVNCADLGSDYSARPYDRPLTKFEQRGQHLGHSVFDVIMKKHTITT